MPKKFDELESQEAAHIEADYVCSVCWGPLITQRVKGEGRLFKVICPKCGEDKGFVTRTYTEKARQTDKLDAIEARQNLGKALGIKEEQFDREKAINQMWK